MIYDYTTNFKWLIYTQLRKYIQSNLQLVKISAIAGGGAVYAGGWSTWSTNPLLTLEEREDDVESPFVDNIGSSEGARDSGVKDDDEDDVVRMSQTICSYALI